MDGRNFDEADFQRLKASFHYSVGKICEERGKELQLEVDKKVISCLAKLGLQQLETFSGDLEAFAKHAKRSTVNADDVKLLARRNPKLLAHLSTLENKGAKSNKIEPTKRQSSLIDFTENIAKRPRPSISTSNKSSENGNTAKIDSGKTTTKQNSSRKRKNGEDKNTEPFIL